MKNPRRITVRSHPSPLNVIPSYRIERITHYAGTCVLCVYWIIFFFFALGKYKKYSFGCASELKCVSRPFFYYVEKALHGSRIYNFSTGNET